MDLKHFGPQKGVCAIADGKLRKLNVHEKRQLLADLRKRGDCRMEKHRPRETTKHTRLSAHCNQETFEPN